MWHCRHHVCVAPWFNTTKLKKNLLLFFHLCSKITGKILLMVLATSVILKWRGSGCQKLVLEWVLFCFPPVAFHWLFTIDSRFYFAADSNHASWKRCRNAQKKNDSFKTTKCLVSKVVMTGRKTCGKSKTAREIPRRRARRWEKCRQIKGGD